MIEITIHGRGGQGGVTLAKLIAEAYFLQGMHVQAFGVYAAERSGAPIQAFVRIDDQDITNHNQIREPDHVIVLDRTLIRADVVAGLKDMGWLILNTPAAPTSFQETFPGRRIATIDATAIAVANGLGTRAVPIVNTTMLGAVGHVLGLTIEDVEAALAGVSFGGANVAAAREAFGAVVAETLPGEISTVPVRRFDGRAAGLFDDEVGDEPRIHTGSWASRRPHRQHLTPPCNGHCPAGNDVQAFIAAAADEDHDRALRILLETTPLPSVCGRVCPAPCMDACNRSAIEGSVNIRDLERFVGDDGHRPPPPAPTREQRVAVVGSGPAGLSTTYTLARLGYPVTLFEAERELGGLMRTGIPTYRLPRDVLDREIDYIVAHAAEVHTGWRVRREALLDASHGFAAVFVATGLQESRSLDLGVAQGGSTDRVMQGIEYLDRVRRGCQPRQRGTVIVVGGGNTAIDAARSARRLGADHVRILYRRTRNEMPAIREEVDAAIMEGIDLHELVMPIRLREIGDGPVVACQRMRLGEPDESGRARPIPETTDDAVFELRCDRVILALGQSPDISILPAGSEIRAGEALLGLTEAPVFCGGDFASKDGTVSAAIGSGRTAALHIHRTLTGADLFAPPPDPPAAPDVIRMHLFERSPRQSGGTIPLAERRATFREVHTGLRSAKSDLAAVTEARRCFSCGVCNSCDRCVQYCPEGIVVRERDGYRFDYDYCKGCGICATQCPRGVIYMSEL